MYRVQLPPESVVARRPLRNLAIFRYGVTSILCVASFTLAVLALVFYIILTISGQLPIEKSKAIFSLVGMFAGSGIGTVLFRVDRLERESVERDEALYLLREEAQRDVSETQARAEYRSVLLKRATLRRK